MTTQPRSNSFPCGEAAYPPIGQSLRNFGENVHYYRLMAGWTQLRLAQQAGVTHQTVSALERGKRSTSLRCAVAVAAALGMPPGKLFGPLTEAMRDQADDSEAAMRSVSNYRGRHSPA